MEKTKEMDILKIRRDVEGLLFKIALKEMNAEKMSGYQRIKLFGNPHSLAFLRAIAPLSGDKCSALLSVLPKRSYVFLKEANPEFFPPQEKRIVSGFVKEFSHLAMPFFPENEEITIIWEQHDTLIRASRGKARQIERCLVSTLKERCKECADYVFATPEPHMLSCERRTGEFRVVVDFEFRHWEFFCGVRLFREDGPSIVSNYTFLGSLGISSAPVWYVDEISALKVLAVCVDHAFAASRAVISALEDTNG